MAVKGQARFAARWRTRALDRHPRCGCFRAMRKMYFSHVPHDQGDYFRPSAARRVPAMKHAAPWRRRASVAHPAACWEQDTIPCAHAQGGPQRGPEPNRDRTQPGHDPRSSGIGSSRVRSSFAVCPAGSTVRQTSGALPAGESCWRGPAGRPSWPRDRSGRRPRTGA